MNIDRIKTVVDFLKDGQSFSVEDLRLGVEGRTITVTGWSQYTNIRDLTKNRSLKELEEIKTLFLRMVDISKELRTFILNKEIEFNLYFDDYGKGSIIVCSEKQGAVKWEMELR